MYYKLKDICKLEKGNIGIQKAESGEYPLVVTAEGRLSSNKYQFNCAACCIPLVSSSGHGHASLKRVHYQTGKFALGNILCAVIPLDETKVLAEYLYVYFSIFKDDVLVPLMKGAANVSMTVADLKNVEVFIPTYEEQLNIIQKYNNILNGIKKIEKINDYSINFIKKMQKKILDDAITGKLNKYTRDNLDGDFPVPKSWKWDTLRNICDYQNGYAYSKPDYSKNKIGIPVIKSNNIMNLVVEISDKTDFVENPTSKMLNSKIVKGDLLMCLSSQSPNPEPLAKTALYTNDEFSLLNQRVLKLTPKNPDHSEYLYYALNSEYYHSNVTQKAGGSGQANLKLEHVLDFPIPIPSENDLLEVINKIKYLYNKVDIIRKINLDNQKYVNLILKIFLKQFIEKESNQK